MTLHELATRAELAEGAGPAVIVGPYGHCLAPGHEGSVVATMHGYALRQTPLALTAATLRVKVKEDV